MKFRLVEEATEKNLEYKGFIIHVPTRQRTCSVVTPNGDWVCCANSIKEAKYYIDTEHSIPGSYWYNKINKKDEKE